MTPTVRVAVAGTMGRMGTTARGAPASENIAAGLRVAQTRSNRFLIPLPKCSHANPTCCSLTTQPGSFEIALQAVTSGLHTVVGASGWNDDQRAALDAAAQKHGVGALFVPNFSLGAMLMMRFAQQAARYFPNAEIVELHHAGKKDKPSGTAAATATAMERAGGRVPVIHSVRLPGLLAHQEVLLGGTGELLTIRHDSFSRESFVAGMLAAVRAVVHRRGLLGLGFGVFGENA